MCVREALLKHLMMASVDTADWWPKLDLRLELIKNSEVRQIIKVQKMAKRYWIRKEEEQGLN